MRGDVDVAEAGARAETGPCPDMATGHAETQGTHRTTQDTLTSRPAIRMAVAAPMPAPMSRACTCTRGTVVM